MNEPAPHKPIETPTQIGAYRLLDHLGDGASAVVYRACHVDDPTQQVAVKLTKAQWTGADIETRVRFEQEAELLSRLSHDNIVRLARFGVHQDRLFLVMELARGMPLSKVIQSRQILSAETAAEILRQAALALAHAHGKGVLHRDVKPSNLMVSLAGGAPEVKVLDFGLSRLQDNNAKSDAVGTFLYMSPEQLGILPQPADERSDIYSLGIMAVELLAGKHPFQGMELREVIHGHAALMPQLPPEVPAGLAAIVMRLVQKDPADRYENARLVAADLGKFLERVRAGEGGAFELTLRQPGGKLRPARFVGRAGQMGALRALYDSARKGETGVGLVAGISGFGKTRLIAEAAKDWTESPVLWSRGRAYGQASGYGLLAEALRALAAQPPSTEQRARLESGVADLAGEIVRLVPEMREMLGPGAQVEETDPDRRRQRFLAAILALFKSLGARQAPPVLILDDIQWADEGSLDLAAELADARFPLLILAGYRSDEVPEGSPAHRFLERLAAKSKAQPILVAPLAAEDVTAVVDSMLGQPLPEVSGAVAALAGGSPLFAAELMHALVESGVIKSGERGWEVSDARKLREARFSDNLIHTIVARLERLSDADREVLTAAAVLGRGTRFTALAGMMAFEGDPGPEEAARRTAQALEAAAQARLVSGPSSAGFYTFSHDKVREALYDKLAPEQRKELHRRAGIALEKTGARDAETIYALAHHFGRSNELESAIDYSLQAGDLARERYAQTEALDFYEQAQWRLDGWEGLAKTRWQRHLWEAVADASCMIGRYEAALAAYDRLLKTTQTREDIVRLKSQIARVYFAKGEGPAAAATVEEALTVWGIKVPRGPVGFYLTIFWETLVQAWHSLFPRREGEPLPPRFAPVERLWDDLGRAYFFGSGTKMLWAHLRHLNFVERFQLKEGMARAWANHAPVCAAIGWPARGIRYAQKSLALRQELGDRWGAAQSRNFLITALFPAGRWREAVEEGRLAEAEFERLGGHWDLAMLLIYLGSAHMFLGDWDRAETTLERSYRLAQSSKNHAGMAFATRAASELEGHFDPQRILQDVRELLPLCRQNPMAICSLWGAKGFALTQLGHHAQAEKAFEEAIEISAREDVKSEDMVPVYHACAEAILCRTEEVADAVERRRLLGRAKKMLFDGYLATLPYPTHSAGYTRVKARWLWMAGKTKSAEKFWRRAQSLCLEQGNVYGVALTLLDWGAALRATDPRRAHHLLRAAWPHLRRLGARVSLARLAEMLPETQNGARPDVLSLSSSHHSVSVSRSHAGSSSAHSGLVEAQRLETLIEVSLRLSATLNLDQLLQMVVDSAARIFGAQRAVLYLQENGRPVRKAAFESEEGAPVSASVLDNVINNGARVLTADAQVDAQLKGAESVVASGVHSIMCVPLDYQGKRVGALYLDNSLLRGLFTEHDLKTLDAFASQAAVAFENAHLFASQERSQHDLQQLYDASKELMGVLDRRRIFSSLLSRSRALAKASAAAVVLFDDGKPSVRLQRHFKPPQIAELENYFREKSVKEISSFDLSDGTSVLLVPLWAQTELEGVLVVGGVQEEGRAKSLLAHVGAQCSLALHNARLFEMAITDEMTKVYQRRYYEMVLKDLAAKKEPFALILIDMNDFKLINDTRGHAVGDAVLKAVGAEMRKALRASDFPARIGGDEFAVILPGDSAKNTEQVVEKLRRAFESIKIEEPGKPPPRVWASFGYGASQEGDIAAIKVLADQRLYEDKKRLKTGRQ